MDITQISPVASGRLGEVQARIITALLGVGADPEQLPTADLCAIITLRHIGEAVEIAQAWLELQH